MNDRPTVPATVHLAGGLQHFHLSKKCIRIATSPVQMITKTFRNALLGQHFSSKKWNLIGHSSLVGHFEVVRCIWLWEQFFLGRVVVVVVVV